MELSSNLNRKIGIAGNITHFIPVRLVKSKQKKGELSWINGSIMISVTRGICYVIR